MPIIRTRRKKHNFTIIDNQGLMDNSLSWKATGLLAFLMTKPDEWEISVENLTHSKRDGRDSTISALEELKSTGYVYHKRYRVQGRFDSEYLVFETQEDLQEWLAEFAATTPPRKNRSGSTTTGKPRRGNRDGETATENPTQVINKEVITDLSITDLSISPLTPQPPEPEGREKEQSDPKPPEPEPEPGVTLTYAASQLADQLDLCVQQMNSSVDHFSAASLDNHQTIKVKTDESSNLDLGVDRADPTIRPGGDAIALDHVGYFVSNAGLQLRDIGGGSDRPTIEREVTNDLKNNFDVDTSGTDPLGASSSISGSRGQDDLPITDVRVRDGDCAATQREITNEPRNVDSDNLVCQLFGGDVDDRATGVSGIGSVTPSTTSCPPPNSAHVDSVYDGDGMRGTSGDSNTAKSPLGGLDEHSKINLEQDELDTFRDNSVSADISLDAPRVVQQAAVSGAFAFDVHRGDGDRDVRREDCERGVASEDSKESVVQNDLGCLPDNSDTADVCLRDQNAGQQTPVHAGAANSLRRDDGAWDGGRAACEREVEYESSKNLDTVGLHLESGDSRAATVRPNLNQSKLQQPSLDAVCGAGIHLRGTDGGSDRSNEQQVIHTNIPMSRTFKSGVQKAEERFRQIIYEWEIGFNKPDPGFLTFMASQMGGNLNMHPEICAFNHLNNCKETPGGIAKAVNAFRVYKKELEVKQARSRVGAANSTNSPSVESACDKWAPNEMNPAENEELVSVYKTLGREKFIEAASRNAKWLSAVEKYHPGLKAKINGEDNGTNATDSNQPSSVQRSQSAAPQLRGRGSRLGRNSDRPGRDDAGGGHPT